MNAFAASIRNFFSRTAADTNLELSNIKAKAAEKKAGPPPAQRAQQTKSASFSIASLFQRLCNSSTPTQLCRTAKTGSNATSKPSLYRFSNVASPVAKTGSAAARPSKALSKALDNALDAMTGKKSDNVVSALQKLQKLDSEHPDKLDALLRSKLTKESITKGKPNAVTAGLFIASLVDGSPLQNSKKFNSMDSGIPQYHADLMRRFEIQYGRIFQDR
jgi:hypothetical protein